MRSKLLVGADAFMERLAGVVAVAKDSVYVQAMTFEGDAAGERLIRILTSAKARDVRLLIDSYSRVVINDRFVFGPEYLKNRNFRKEVRNTRELVAKARVAGIQVQFTNPVGWLMSRYPLRNHKKMVIVDRKISYIGGINFSDHNFEWHDMMIELDSLQVGQALAADFESTWMGTNQSCKVTLEKATLFFLNGSRSRQLYEEVFEVIRCARASVRIISPYISEPLLSVLKHDMHEGVQVSIIAPEKNNKSIFKDHLLSELAQGYFELYHYPEMSHLKAILVDDETLIFGSSNYDLVSYHFEQEVVMVTRDYSTVRAFRQDVLGPTMQQATLQQARPGGPVPGLVLKALDAFARSTSSSILRPK